MEADALFGWTNRLLSGTLTAGSEDALMPVLNLRSPQGSPAMGWQTQPGVVSAGQGAWFLLDSGDTGATWRAFLLARTNLSPTATVRWRVGEENGLVEETPLAAIEAAAAVPALPAGLTWTRTVTGKATRTQANGIIQEVDANTIRIDHHPVTGAPLGALVEGAATNFVRNPRGEGTTAGAPGVAATHWAHGGANGITTSIHGWGVNFGIRYVALRCQGTVATGQTGNATVWFETGTGIAAAQGEEWCGSFYLRLDQTLAGPGPSGGDAILSFLNSGGSVVETATDDFPAPTRARITALRPSVADIASDAATAYLRPSCRLYFPPGTHDCILWIAAPQAENGLVPTSLLLPAAGTPAVSSRGADTGTLILAGSITSGTFYSEASVARSSQPFPANAITMGLGDGTANNIVRTFVGIDAPLEVKATVRESNVAQITVPNLDAGPLDAAQRIAVAFATNDILVAGNGTVMATQTTATAPSVNRMQVFGSAESVAHLRSMRVYAERLTDGQVLALSATGSTVDASLVTYDSGTVPAGVVPGFAQSVVVAEDEVTGRFCRCDIDDPQNPDGWVNVPLAYAGPAQAMMFNIGWGTAHERTRVGQTVVTRGGARYPETYFTERVWDIALDSIAAQELWPVVMEWVAASDDGANVIFIPDPTSDFLGREAVLGIAEAMSPVTYPIESTDFRAKRVRVTERR